MKLVRILFFILISINLSSCGLVVSVILEIIKSSGEETETTDEVKSTDSKTSTELIIFNEEFENNQNEWSEEESKLCNLKIKDGHYKISNLVKNNDTSWLCGYPLNVAFLKNLPEHYIISSRVSELSKLGKNEVYSGIDLISSKDIYRFHFYSNGRIRVGRFNNLNQNTDFIIDTFIRTQMIPLDFTINVHNKEFDLKVNSIFVAKNTFKSNNWESIRLLTSNSSTSKFEFLQIF